MRWNFGLAHPGQAGIKIIIPEIEEPPAGKIALHLLYSPVKVSKQHYPEGFRLSSVFLDSGKNT